MNPNKSMRIAVTGHVDHGKSTLIGRLLHDTNSLPEGKMEEIKKICRELGRKFEFAFLIDYLEEERENAMTIGTSQLFFRTKKRRYTIIDTPGHTEFIKDMVTGASQAEAAVLIVDLKEGVKEQTRRHAHFLSLLGISQVVVALNKIDLIGYDAKKIETTEDEITSFLSLIGVKPKYCIPISAATGENVVKKTGKSLSLVEALDSLEPGRIEDGALRLSVQDVYMIDGIPVNTGRIESGNIKMGEIVTILPLNKKEIISSLKFFNKEKAKAEQGESIGFIIKDTIERGCIICQEPLPHTATEFDATLFCISKKNLKVNKELVFRCLTQESRCRIKKIYEKMDSSTLVTIDKDLDMIKNMEIGRVRIKTESPVVIENSGKLSRFVLARGSEICAGGLIHKV